MFHLILLEPEIPQNAGNIIRLCANTGATLHLVHPLGFATDDAGLRRAGLDYRDLARVREHGDLPACLRELGHARVFAVETSGGRHYGDAGYGVGDAFLFGRESVGLPRELVEAWPADRLIRLPMVPGNRSLNLSNAAAVVIYEAWRQLDFAGSE
ncbi:MAG TPA: tRNA (cytidine(34)-2'-O)-methyltransferase [Steroidobacteraceae bacterium]|nr:tRNA (cytidine(34)-2'-O)-methyltransferase [Steroidobacteraceae bacterium]